MMFLRKATNLIVGLLILAIPAAVYAERQNIYDWWQLHDYNPPAQIVGLASNTTMTSYGKKLFYVNHPQLEDILLFRQDCSNSEKTIVLGCYIDKKGIFVYKVTDSRLNGVLEVTAAHEMLHAAYDRLSDQERQQIDQLTAQAFSQLSDQRIKNILAQYRAKDPAVVPNELHSILGTEVSHLPSVLEKHYSQYFRDRSKIVAYSEQYEAEFVQRENQVANYDQQLSQLKQQIDASEKSLDKQIATIQSQRNQLQSLLASNQREEYNNQVPAFNSLVNRYNSEVNAVKNLINKYNDIVEERNAIAKEIKDLAKAIDTRATLQQAQ